MNYLDLQRELAAVLNRHSVDTETNTPDFILADVAMDAIRAFGMRAKRRDEWRGIKPWTPELTELEGPASATLKASDQ